MTVASALIVRYRREVRLRHRKEGHVRFELPAELAGNHQTLPLHNRLMALTGVQHVSISRGAGKLSVHYDATACDLPAIAHAIDAWLHDCAGGVYANTPASTVATNSNTVLDPTGGLGQQIRDRIEEAKETLAAIVVVSRRAANIWGGDKSAGIIEFFTDALVLFLIKLHWHMITQHWLKRPWTHRYEWMAAFYMIFLLVRSRRNKSDKAEIDITPG